MKPLVALFVFEILAGANAGIVFSKFERSTAGLIAGIVFCALGTTALYVFTKNSVKFKNLNLAVAAVFLFVFSLPLLIARLATPMTHPVETILSIPMHIFHQGSQHGFEALVIVTVVQIFFAFSSKRT